MEDTHPNNDNTRKRRSSILKSQRVSRTPFSDLEFNVTTPPDTSKYRRVSFSKRTGVAEFVTNEATTTWRNFYEEQNRSHETSGHESGSHKPSIGHIGNRIFEQQFEEMEAEIDFGSTMGVPCNNVNTSVNVTEELALLDTTEDNVKITAPQTKFELSSFTEHSKAFRSELTNPIINDMSEHIKVNFSVMNPIGKDGDDLDEIERDLKFEQSNVGPAFGVGNKSQFIELDFNTTQGLIRDDNGSDMSITETINSPKKEVSKIPSVNTAESKRSNVKDWVEDKENIVVIPYVSPVKSEVFAVKKPAEQVLVFDGKKVQYADIDADLDAIIEDSKFVTSHRGMLSNTNKSIVFNDDNPLADMSVTTVVSGRHANNTNYNDDADADMSITAALQFESIDKHNKIYKNDEDKTITRALPSSNVNKTLIYSDDADMSITKAIPTVNINKIIIYNENSYADMSITRTVPDRNADNTKTINDKDIVADMSMTKVIPSAHISGAPIWDGRTKDDISLPNVASIKNVSKNTTYSKEADKSITKVAPTGFINTTNIYNDEITVADMSITKAIPTVNINKIIIYNENSYADMSITRTVPDRNADNTKTINDKDIVADMSMTKVIPSAHISGAPIWDGRTKDDISLPNVASIKNVSKNTTYSKEADKSITKVAPTGFINTTNIYNDEITVADMSITKAIPTVNINKIIIYNENSYADMSITKTVPDRNADNTKTINDKDIVADMSMTKVIPSAHISGAPIWDGRTKDDISLPNVASIKNVSKNTTYSKEADKSITKVAPTGFINTTNIYNDEITVADMSITRPVPHMLHENRRKTILFNDFEAEISITECIPPINTKEIANIKEEQIEKSKMSIAHSIVHDLWHQQTESIENFKNINNLPLTKVAPISIDNNNDIDLSDDVCDSMSSLPKEEELLVQAASHQDEKLKQRLLSTLMLNENDDDVVAKRIYPVEILESMMVREDVPTKKAVIPDSLVPKQSLKIPRSGHDDNTVPSSVLNDIIRLNDDQNFVTKISIEPKKEDEVQKKSKMMKELSTYSSDWLSTTPEFTSTEDIAHKINQLKFLGSSIWEWERRAGDKWSFLLLRSRIRLSVIFASTDVKPSTQVTVTVFEPTQKETLNHLSSLCVRFALGAMRQSSAEFTRAADLPQVLLRCAGVSRLATQWLKAMWDARARLGYRIHGDEVVFKVANVPLRSVYEVSIRMTLAAHPSGLFPRAGTPRVRAVVAPGNVSRSDAAALVKSLDENWGHVPKAIWRVFKLLKDKTEDAIA